MPNWCDNSIIIEGQAEDIKEIWDIIQLPADESANLMAVRPRPDDVGDNWYEWSLVNWGTKWEMDVYMVEYSNHVNSKPHIHLQGMTAWSPPIALLTYISDQWPVTIFHEYEEDGMDFIGAAVLHGGKSYDSWSNISDNLPDDIDFVEDYDRVLDIKDEMKTEHSEKAWSMFVSSRDSKELV